MACSLAMPEHRMFYAIMQSKSRGVGVISLGVNISVPSLTTHPTARHSPADQSSDRQASTTHLLEASASRYKGGPRYKSKNIWQNLA